ncbi:MAG: DUF6516 family protein, partial [bacterium]|nr:DUF6516 family protein [bacterium]
MSLSNYAFEIENAILSSPLVIHHDFKVTIASPSTGYIEARVVFEDGSILALFEFLRLMEDSVIREKYRYHYMSQNSKMIFRYDNAAHHKEISTFPDHKHSGEKIIESFPPQIKIVLTEIE